MTKFVTLFFIYIIIYDDFIQHSYMQSIEQDFAFLCLNVRKVSLVAICAVF